MRIDFTDVPTKTLISAHNACAKLLGSKPVAKFSDRATAEKRTRFLLSQIAPEKRPEPFTMKPVETPAVRQVTDLKTEPVPHRLNGWRKPKTVKPPGRVAYRPRAGSQQAKAYELLTKDGGILAEDFCEQMNPLLSEGSAPWVPHGVWSVLRFLFVKSKGYGLEFDGQRFKLIVPADERTSRK